MYLSFPGGSDGKESAFNVGVFCLIPGCEDPLEEAWQPHPVFFLEKSRGQRSLVDYSLKSNGLQRVQHNWAHTESCFTAFLYLFWITHYSCRSCRRVKVESSTVLHPSLPHFPLHPTKQGVTGTWWASVVSSTTICIIIFSASKYSAAPPLTGEGSKKQVA